MTSSKKRRDNLEEDEEPMAKKVKRNSTTTKLSKNTVSKDSDGNEYWELAGKKRVVVSEFKGQRMISIREYYEKDGQALPGKKGISLPIAQFSTFVSLLPEIEKVLRGKGEDVVRPEYDSLLGKTEDDASEEEGVSGREKKRNFEETSDED